MKIGFHALHNHRIPFQAVNDLGANLHLEGFEICLSAKLLKPFSERSDFGFPYSVFSNPAEAADISAMLSLGGDGTLLDTLLFTLQNKIPLLGVNFGRMGFLPCIQDSSIMELASLLNQEVIPVEERAVLEIESGGQLNPFSEFPFALNEVAIMKKETASMITIKTNVDGVFLNEYWGDGLIISSPTGSTGYSLSCGGPILWPDSEVIVLTPVSPHNLSMRPIVLSDKMEITLIPKGRSSKILVSMDSRSKSIPVNQVINIRKSSEKALFIKISPNGFPNTLREKLLWGKDIRN
jgi:NAD+ kinase